MTNQKEAPEGVSFLAISEKDRGARIATPACALVRNDSF